MRRRKVCGRSFVGPAIALLLTFSPLGSLDALPSPKEKWKELRTPNFRIYGNSSSRVLRDVTENLEQLRAVIDRAFPFDVTSPVPTHVYVFVSNSKFDPYRPYYGGRPKSGVAGYFLPRLHANYIAINGDFGQYVMSPLATIYHEYSHYVLRNNYASLPVWFDEGMAEYFSTFVLEKGEAHIGRARNDHVQRLRRSSMLPLRDLFAVDHSSPVYNEGDRANLFYAQSWALVHYFFSGNPERLPRMTRFLDLLASGEQRDKAFLTAFEISYAGLESELLAYVRKPSLPFSRVPVDALAPEMLEPRSMEHDDVLYRLGDLLAHHTDRGADAREHLRAVSEVSSLHGLALAGLGYLAQSEDRVEDALGFYERAVEARPNHYLPAFLYGDLLTEVGSMDEASERATAREALESCVAQVPDFAPAWARLAYLATFEGEVSDVMLALGERARDLLPSRRDVAVNLFNLYLRGERVEKARDLLEGTLAGMASPMQWARYRTNLVRLEMRGLSTLADAGRHEEAVSGAEDLLARTSHPEDRKRVETHLRILRANYETERYNVAVDLCNASNYAACRDQLEALLAEMVEKSSLRVNAERLLERALGKLAD